MTGREFLVRDDHHTNQGGQRRRRDEQPAAGARLGAGVAEMGAVGEERGAGDPALRDGGWQSQFLNSSVSVAAERDRVMLPVNTPTPTPSRDTRWTA
eukprot:gene10917-17036_t